MIRRPLPCLALFLASCAAAFGQGIASYDFTREADRAAWNDTTWITPTANYSSGSAGLTISGAATQNSSWYEITPHSLGGATSIEVTGVWQRNGATAGNITLAVNWLDAGNNYLGTTYLERSATETLDTLDQILDVPSFGATTPSNVQIIFVVIAPPNADSSFTLQSAGVAASAVSAENDRLARMAARTWPASEGIRSFFNEADWGTPQALGKTYLLPDGQTLQVLIDNPRRQHDQYVMNDDNVYVGAADHLQLTYTVNAAAPGLACTINFTDRQFYVWSATLSGNDMTVGTHTVSIPLSAFTVTNSAVNWILPPPLPVGNGILSTSLSWDSSQGISDIRLAQAKYLIGGQATYILDPTGSSYAQDNIGLHAAPYPSPWPAPSYNDTTHRVYFAENSVLLNDTGRLGSIVNFANANFPGAFGVDCATQLYPDLAASTAAYKGNGIRPIFEGHMTDIFFERSLINTGRALVRPADRFSINDTDALWNDDDLSNQTALLNLTADTSQPTVIDQVEAKMDAAFRAGFSEFMLVDYIWPYMGGDWGDTDSLLSRFHSYLQGRDPLQVWNPAAGRFKSMTFWQYAALFTDHAYSSAELGYGSWAGYRPVEKRVAQSGTHAQQLNYYLYDLLWHYHYLHTAQTLGDYAYGKGFTFQVSLNGEDPADGTDLSLLPRLRGMSKAGYEFFASPLYNQVWYRVFPWYSAQLAGSGNDIGLIGEIASGGWGSSRYDAPTAYAHYYAATRSSRACDYNNQYMNYALWSEPTQRDARYAHWMAGALAFTEGWKELPPAPPAQPPVVLVASRGVIEAQPSFTLSFAQTYNASSLLDAMHLPFVACGRDALAGYALAPTTQVLVYTPAESNARDWAALRAWLRTGSGKTLITHSGVPFSLNDGTHRFGQAPVNTTANAAFPSLDPGYPGLIQTITVGENHLLYLPQDTVEAWATAFAMLPAVVPEIDAPSSVTVQAYPVPGGRSYVAWDIATLQSQQPVDYYSQTAIAPVPLGFPSPDPAHDVQVYDFFDDTVTTVTAGNPIGAVLSQSSGVYYVGDAASSDWASTLANARATRAKFQDLLQY